MPSRDFNTMTELQENLTGYMGTIDSDHAYIHKGIAFTSFITTPAITAAYRIGFKTPTVASGKYIHWRPIGITSSADYVSITMTEDDSYTGGTANTPMNRNRNFSTVSVMQDVKYGVTSTPAGTVVSLGGIGSAGNPTAKTGGGNGAAEELLLLPNTSYVITLVPEGSTVCTLALFWYEENGYDGS
jgi:hypothetical protein